MQRRTVFKTSISAAMALIIANQAVAQEMDETSQATFDTVIAFMGPWVLAT